ncbi:hypothetical protein [Saccharopolyspora shandongensis]|uniref:hypothetical protein n=1 Tax=Saccharopolyspora shandongensis TaxID=418495 RepID=UPI0033C348E5
MLNFHRNTIKGTHGEYVAHSERTGRAYVLSRSHGEWLLTVHHSIAYPGGALSYDPDAELVDSTASDMKRHLVNLANSYDADASEDLPLIGGAR